MHENRADVTHAPSLIEGLRFDALLADKGYDADWLVDLVKSTHGAEPVIQPPKGRKQPRNYDRHTYKQRNLVERFIGSAKHFRRAATRYENISSTAAYNDYIGAIDSTIGRRFTSGPAACSTRGSP